MKKSLLVGWQYVFPSPVYPSLQEHLNEPSVFEQDARLWKQSCDPCTHSSTSKNDKENRLFPAKIPEKISCDGRKKKHWNSTNKGKDHLNLWELFVCLFVGEPINDKFINGERERGREKGRKRGREKERKKERGTKSVLLKPKLLSKIKVQFWISVRD